WSAASCERYTTCPTRCACAASTNAICCASVRSVEFVRKHARTTPSSALRSDPGSSKSPSVELTPGLPAIWSPEPPGRSITVNSTPWSTSASASNEPIIPVAPVMSRLDGIGRPPRTRASRASRAERHGPDAGAQNTADQSRDVGLAGAITPSRRGRLGGRRVRFALVGGGPARGRRRRMRRTTHRRRGTTHDVTGAALVVPDLAALGRGCTANEGAGGNFERDWLPSHWARGRFFWIWQGMVGVFVHMRRASSAGERATIDEETLGTRPAGPLQPPGSG